MKALLNKEFKLCLHPTVFIYLGLILMLLIPNYPYLVSCFFVCNAIFFIFQTARENGDAMYTAMLPVSKAQAVRARVLFVVIIQAIDLLLMAGMCAFALIRYCRPMFVPVEFINPYWFRRELYFSSKFCSCASLYCLFKCLLKTNTASRDMPSRFCIIVFPPR